MPKSTRSACPYILSSPTFPPEIVDLIIQDDKLDSSDFPNLSLVSYVWKEPSQRRLFSSISVDPGKEHPLFSILPNSDGGRLIRYIKHLTLLSTSTTSWIPFSCDSDDDVQFQFEDIPEVQAAPDDLNNSEFSKVKLGATHIHMVPDPEASGPPHPKFSSFLHQLSRLETLVVRDRLNWYLLPRDVTQALLHVFGLESFRSLDIWRDSATRLPFIFLHFCYNLKHLSLNVWPTKRLKPIGILDSDVLTLKGKPNMRPTVLKLIGADVVDSLKYYIERAQAKLGNSITLDRLHALYIAYEEDPAYAVTGGLWPSKRIGSFLLSFGHSLTELVLEIDHRSFTSRDSSAIPAADLSNLDNLTNLRLIIHNGPLPGVDFNEGFCWVLPFLKNLPSPSKLATFQLLYTSTFKWTEDFDDWLPSGENFLEELFELLSSSFTGLKAIALYMKLLSTNVPLDAVPVLSCGIVNRDDYAGLVELRARGVHLVSRVVMQTSFDEGNGEV